MVRTRSDYICEVCDGIWATKEQAEECESKGEVPERLNIGTVLQHTSISNNPRTIIEKFEGIDVRHRNIYASVTLYTTPNGNQWYCASRIKVGVITDGKAFIDWTEYLKTKYDGDERGLFNQHESELEIKLVQEQRGVIKEGNLIFPYIVESENGGRK